MVFCLHILLGLDQVRIQITCSFCAAGYINEGGTLNLERFQKYMERLSAFDLEQFRETYADLKYFQGKTGRRLGSKERYSVSTQQ
jgi:5'-3' exoribonuclease 1